jgi:ATP-dependent Lon protease
MPRKSIKRARKSNSFTLSDEVYNEVYDEDYSDNYISSRKLDKKSYDILSKIKEEIVRNEPTLYKIINEPLLLCDQAKLLQLFEIYKCMEPNTEIWFENRIEFNKIFNECKCNYARHSKYTVEQHKEMNDQLDILKIYDSDLDKNAFKYKILQLETSIENKKIIYSKYQELLHMHNKDDEYGKLKNWLNWAICIPHNKIKIFTIYNKDKLTQCLQNISVTLNTNLYGMNKVKEQILLFVSSKIQNPHIKKCSLGLVGAPGTGKTFLAKLLAKVLNFPFEQISFGGMASPAFLKGHEYTYIGSQPGEIVKCLKRMEYKNGIIFFDEYDKISNNQDICSALLHITDPVQNSEFKDLFLSEITIDLSYLWFIYSMNKLPSDHALRDRIFSIEVPGYTTYDKIYIIIDYLFPKVLVNNNKKSTDIFVSKSTAKYLIEQINGQHDQGVRSIEKAVNDIVTKLDFVINHQDKQGKLPNFNVSFEFNMFLKYPIILTNNIIQKCLK